MRLVCPNCDAQYEVDDGVIPAGGRDVQCSNCGHTWFQPGAEDAADEAAAAAAEAAPEQEAAPETAADAAPEMSADDAAAPESRRALDPSVLDVLREEAEFEREARAAERTGETFESQPNLGLDEAGAMRERMARLRGVEPDEDESRLDEATPRSELLPDVEEINSTLRAASERPEDVAPMAGVAVDSGGGGFRRGYVLALAVFALAAAIYLFSGRIAAMVPAAEPALAGYTRAVDSGMTRLNSLAERAVQAVTAQLSGDEG